MRFGFLASSTLIFKKMEEVPMKRRRKVERLDFDSVNWVDCIELEVVLSATTERRKHL
jgi:hypothetical protein